MSMVQEREQIIPSGTWNLDPVHSSIGFAVRHMAVGTFRGQFDDFDANLAEVDGTSTLTGTVRVSSVRVQDENLNAHLLAPDFFDAERHPELRFSSSDVRRDGDDLVVEGELTIKGVTHPVQLRGTISGPGVDAYGNDRLGLELETEVDRRLFGLEWNSELPGGGLAVSNEATLSAQLSLVKGAWRWRFSGSPAACGAAPSIRGCSVRRPRRCPRASSCACGTASRPSRRTTRTTTASRRPRRCSGCAERSPARTRCSSRRPSTTRRCRGSSRTLSTGPRPIATNVLRNKPVGVVGASTGAFGAVWAQAELRKVLSALGARVVEGDLALGHAAAQLDQEDRLVSEEHRMQLAELLENLVREAAPVVRSAA